MSLAKYNRKRKFRKTPEPLGKQAKKSELEPLQFVVQKHDASRLHYDFRLEVDGVFKSWAVPKGPSMNPKDKRLALMTENHPLSYASFEGTIPEGEYGGGEVIVWDRGVYMSLETDDPLESRKKIKAGLHKGDLKIALLGEKLKGGFALVKIKGDDPDAWLLIKKGDMYAAEKDVTRDVRSALSGGFLSRDKKKRNAPILKKDRIKMPHSIKPMLAKPASESFDRKGWLFEVKWDGYRAIAEIEKGKASLYSRNGNSFNSAYPSIVKALEELPHQCILDGEIVAIADGKASFQALQYYKETPVALQYVAFDILWIEGRDLRNEPLMERKKILEALIPDAHPTLIYSEHVREKGIAFFREAMKKEIEGIVAKKEQSPYREGVRSDEWLKIKTQKEQEAVIAGFTEPRGSRKYIGSLILAAYNRKGELKYIGHSGGGFTDRELKMLNDVLKKIETKEAPFKDAVPLPVHSPITWVKPMLVCRITFTEWTSDGRMRHPIYGGLREDKPPKSVFIEERIARVPATEESRLAFSNTDKIFWPDEGYTKGDVIAYYDEMAEILLPYLKDRPQNLNRHPNGIRGESFYQKNFDQKLPSFVETKEIWSESNSDFRHYILCQNRETLLYLANLGCIELNPWNSRTGSLEYPDYVILDLDPNGRPFEDLIKVAREVREVLAMACDRFCLKTSGKTGLHIVLPLDATYTYDEIRMFSRLIMQIVHQMIPDTTSTIRTPGKRKGKIYLDYLQNRFGQTLACAYSLRPFPQAPVSTPIEWHELRTGFKTDNFNIKTISKRIKEKGDLWKPILGKGIDLREAITRLQRELGKK